MTAVVQNGTARQKSSFHVKQSFTHWIILRYNNTQIIDQSTLSYPMILVGGNGGKFRFLKDERLKVFCQRDVLGLRIDVDGVKPRLILVHWVQDYLQRIDKYKYNNNFRNI